MNYSTAVFLINKTVRAIRVSYEPDGTRADEAKAGSLAVFKSFDGDLKPKDLVVVPTDTRWRMTVARVEEVDVDVDFDGTTELKWIIGRVDRRAFEDVLVREAEAISAIRSAEVRRKREELAKALFADNDALRNLPIATADRPLPSPPVTEQ